MVKRSLILGVVLLVLQTFAYSLTIQAPIKPWSFTQYLYEPSQAPSQGYVTVTDSNGLVIYSGNNVYRTYSVNPPENGTVYIYIKDENGNDLIQRDSYSVTAGQSLNIIINKSITITNLPARIYLIITLDPGIFSSEKVIYYETIYYIKNGQNPENRVLYTLSYLHNNIGMQIANIKNLIDIKLSALSNNVAALAGKILIEQYAGYLIQGALGAIDPTLSTFWDVVDALNEAKSLTEQDWPTLVEFAIAYAQAFTCSVDSAQYISDLIDSYNKLWDLIVHLHNTTYSQWRNPISQDKWNIAGANLHEYMVLTWKYKCNLAYNLYCDWSGIETLLTGYGVDNSDGIYGWARWRIFPEYLYIASKVLKSNPQALADQWRLSGDSNILCNTIDYVSMDSEISQFLQSYPVDKLIFGNPPQPQIVNVSYPTSIIKGNDAIVVIEVKNAGSDAIYGSVTISFPYLSNVNNVTIQSSGGLNVYIKNTGDIIYDRKCNPITSTYPLIELGGQWVSGETKFITLSIDTSTINPGDLTFYVRSTMTNVNDFWCHYVNHSSNSTRVDQQGWPVNVYSISVTTNPPSGSISINSGAPYTNSSSVTLNLTANDDYTPPSQLKMCIKNSQTTCYSYDWVQFASSKSWSLPSGDGNKCVYVKFKDSDGNESQWYNDCIVLDTQPPTTPSLTANASDGQISLSWTSVSDSTSGFSRFVLRRSTGGYPSCTSGTQVYSGTGTSYTDTGLTNGTTYYYRLCAYDKAGNYSSATASATPQITKYTLSVSKNGSGTVTSSPSGINCGNTCSAQFNRGTSVTLTASPASGYYFSSWTGCDSTFGNTCSITMNSNKSVTATFSACTYSINPTSQTFNYKGGTGSISVSTNSTCSWAASSNCSWVSITSGTSGTGNGTINYSVSRNTGSTQRICTITVAGKTFTVTQSANQPPTTPTISGPTSGQTGQSLSFSVSSSDPEGDTIQYRFDWGDGNISAWGSSSQSHSWSSAGSYCVKAQAKDSNGTTSAWSSCHTVSISSSTPTNNPPVINSFTANPSSGAAPLDVTFSWDISDADGDNLTCKLDIDNDGRDDYTINNCTNSSTQSHTYLTAGTYTAKLTVSDGNGGSDSTTVTINVSSSTPTNNPPVINSFTANPSSGAAPLDVTFSWDISDADGDNLTCKLDIDNDGRDDYTINNCTNSSTQSHTYLTAGTYTAKLTVSDGNGGSDSTTVTINVSSSTPTNNPPVINSFIADPAIGTAPLNVFFSWDISDPDGDVLTCHLDVDNDGTNDYTINNCTTDSPLQSHTYSTPGNYTAKLTVSDGNGGSDFATVTINVGNTPPSVWGIGYSYPYDSNMPITVDFECYASDPDGYITEYRWDFDGDGRIDQTTNSKYTSFTYSVEGAYNVKCIAVDNYGATGDYIEYVYIYSYSNDVPDTTPRKSSGGGCSAGSGSSISAYMLILLLLKLIFKRSKSKDHVNF